MLATAAKTSDRPLISSDRRGRSAYSVIKDMTRRHSSRISRRCGAGPDRGDARAQPNPARRWEMNNLSPKDNSGDTRLDYRRASLTVV